MSGGAEVSVLVVDDDFMVARIHARFVEQTDGFEVVGVASTGAQATTAAARIEAVGRSPRAAAARSAVSTGMPPWIRAALAALV